MQVWMCVLYIQRSTIPNQMSSYLKGFMELRASGFLG